MSRPCLVFTVQMYVPSCACVYNTNAEFNVYTSVTHPAQDIIGPKKLVHTLFLHQSHKVIKKLIKDSSIGPFPVMRMNVVTISDVIR